QVMRVLPDALGHDQRRIGIDVSEDLHPRFLAVDKAVLLLFAVSVRADDLIAHVGDDLPQGLFHFRLFRPALLVGTESQIAVGDQLHLLFLQLWRFGKGRDGIVRHSKTLRSKSAEQADARANARLHTW